MEHPEIYFVRHGETEWSLNGRHTGTSDIPLTENGVKEAEKIRDRLKGENFDHVFTSPLQRAKTTCEIAGFGEKAIIHEKLIEWNYGEFEGITTEEIHKTVPGWNVFTHGGPGGESVEDITKRIDSLLDELLHLRGKILLFAHGHFLRTFAARYVKLSASDGKIFVLGTGTLTHLGWYRESPVILLWNG